MTKEEQKKLAKHMLKDFLISGAFMGPAITFLAEYPLVTHPLFAPVFASTGLVVPHPGVTAFGAAAISGYLGWQRFMKLISDKETIKDIAERKEPLFFR